MKRFLLAFFLLVTAAYRMLTIGDNRFKCDSREAGDCPLPTLG